VSGGSNDVGHDTPCGAGAAGVAMGMAEAGPWDCRGGTATFFNNMKTNVEQ